MKLLLMKRFNCVDIVGFLVAAGLADHYHNYWLWAAVMLPCSVISVLASHHYKVG